MTQDATTYYVWIGGSCDYGHKERAGGSTVIIEQNGKILDIPMVFASLPFRYYLSPNKLSVERFKSKYVKFFMHSSG